MGPGVSPPEAPKEIAVVVSSKETQILAFRPLGNGQLSSARVLADFWLRVFAQREDGMRHFGLAQHAQHVGLVLVGIDPTQQDPFAAARLDPSVMAGGEVSRSQAEGILQKMRPTDRPVALDARIGSDALRVAIKKERDNVFAEDGLHVDDVEGNAEP
jgi:hypothetical protein